MIVMPLLTILHDLLRTCQFTAFWKSLNGDSEGAQSEAFHQLDASTQSFVL